MIIAFALCSVSFSSFYATESNTIPAPACTKPLFFPAKILLIAIAKSQHPLNEKYPTAPAYVPLCVGSNSWITYIALTFGAPETVPAGKTASNASYMSYFLFNLPTTCVTMCWT